MSRTRQTASILASPALVGAVTVLITLVAVFLAYNANKGLPFVPTYNFGVEVPDAANLVPGNEVRIGGFRVGQISQIKTKTITQRGQTRAIALLDLKIEKTVEPLAADSTAVVRPRSALGLKYLQIDPGTGTRMLRPGETLSLSQTTEVVEFDDLLNTFDAETRTNSQIALQGFGDGLTGRGIAINESLRTLGPFLGYLEPVAQNLSDPDTDIDNFFRQLGRTTAQLAPVAEVQAQLFTTMADTFEAISRSPQALRQTIEKTAPTLDTAIGSFPIQRPFLADFTDLELRLRPAVQTLPQTLPQIAQALEVGTPVQRKSPVLYRNVEDVLRALGELTSDPNTMLAIQDLRQAVRVSTPLITFINPYQSVCSYFNYFFTSLHDVVGAPTQDGTAFRADLHHDNNLQDDRLSDFKGDRQADVPKDFNPKNNAAFPTGPAEVLHGQAYQPAVDAAGNADCQAGQNGYLDGPFIPAYSRTTTPTNDPAKGGPNHLVVIPDTPGLAGPTFSGVPNLSNVP